MRKKKYLIISMIFGICVGSLVEINCAKIVANSKSSEKYIKAYAEPATKSAVVVTMSAAELAIEKENYGYGIIPGTDQVFTGIPQEAIQAMLEADLQQEEISEKKKKKPKKKLSEREAIVELAKSYKGKISYFWGGKATDSQIAGDEEPRALDCSGFVQFVFSRYFKTRVPELGSTVVIAKLDKIKKKELKPGDIGLRLGKGSLYYDADNKGYPSTALAYQANVDHITKRESKINERNKKIKFYEKEITKLEDKVKEQVSEKKKLAGGNINLKGATDDENLNIPLPEETVLPDNTSLPEDTVLPEETALPDYTESPQRIPEEYREKISALDEQIFSEKAHIDKITLKVNGLKSEIAELKAEKKRYEVDIIRKIDHVGIYCGKDKKGRDIWCHCSSGRGVVYENTDLFKHYFRYLNDEESEEGSQVKNKSADKSIADKNSVGKSINNSSSKEKSFGISK